MGLDIERGVRGIAALLTGLVGFGYILSQVDLGEVLAATARMDLGLFLLGLPLLLLINMLMAYRWQQVLDGKGVVISYPAALVHQLEAAFVNSFMPARAGDIYKGYLAPGERSTLDNTVLVLLERVADLCVLLVLAAIVVVGFFPAGGLMAYLVLGVLLLAGFAFGVTIVWRLEELPLPWGARIYARLREALMENLRTDRVGMLVSVTVVIWMVSVLRHWTTFAALDIGAAVTVVALVSFTWALVSAVPLTPAGLGAVDAVTYFVLVSFGVADPVAGSYVLVTRLIIQGFQLVTGGILFVRRHGTVLVRAVD